MSAAIDIAPGERGRIRVFAVNAAPEEVQAMLARLPKADVARQLLGAPHLDTRSAEVFPIKDLEGVGLAQYLVDGYAVPEKSIGDDRRRLEALEGYAMLLFSDSFGGAGARLHPGPEVTLIGTYAETLADHRQRPTPTPSAAAYSGAQAQGTAENRAGILAKVFRLLALAVCALILLWWALT